jgi:predicted ATPase
MDVLVNRPFPLCAYVIGNNGQGKSMLLAQLADELSEHYQHTAGIAFGLTDRFRFSSAPQANRGFTYLGARTAEASVSVSVTRRRMQSYVRAVTASSQRIEALRAALNILGFGHNLYLIPDGLADRNGVIPEKKLADILELTRAPADVPLPKRFSLAVLALDNRVIPFEKLSSGEQQLITLAVKLCAFAERSWVIFIDEPELSLHVSWQRALPRMLTDLSRHLECALVVATHSPVLMAATAAEDFCFQAERQTLTPLTHSSLASVEAVLFEDFGTYTANTRRVHELCAQTVASVMHRLNGVKVISSTSVRDEALQQLDKIKDVVEAAGRTGDGGERDLELVRRARAAVAEVFAQLNLPVEQSGESDV